MKFLISQLNKKHVAILLMLLFFTQTFFYGTMEAKAMFSDTVTSPYRESIEYLVGKNILQGNPDGSFKPDAFMTRAEFITVIVRAFGSTQDIGTLSNCFTDVRTEWFARYVCFAKENNLVKGHPDGSFKPAANVSYVESISMAAAAAKVVLVKSPLQKEWYEPFLEFAHNNNIFSKYSMLPGAPLTRAKAAFVIHQILLIENGSKKINTTRKNYSSGCGEIPPTVPPTSIRVGEATRTMITAIPSTYNQNTPIKLVFAIHGRTNSNTMVRGYYKVEQAAQGKAIFIYPSGRPSGSAYTWGQQDIPFFDALLSQFSQQYCLDLDEVYAVGHSLGGSMTHQLACARGDVIRGVATVGGGSSKLNNCSGPVAAMIWHNPKDNLVPFSSGIVARDNIKRQNQLGDFNYPAEPTWANCVAYTDGQPDAPLYWCPHTQDYEDYGSKQYYPHVWPKNAGSEIWKFFEKLNT